jgi:hypothetical protein
MHNSVPQSTNLPTVSVKDQSTSLMTAAIRSLSDRGETLKRANSCLALYFDPDNDTATKVEMRQAFVRALDHLPEWAMHIAFDTWERTGTRRPSPAEIVILADRQLQPMRDELNRRKKAEDEAQAEADAKRAARVTPEVAARIMAEAGLTPDRIALVKRFPMARTVKEAREVEDRIGGPEKHWSETAGADDPRWAMLRASRLASGLCHE